MDRPSIIDMFKELIREIQKAFGDLSTIELPTKGLYHYTNAEGMKGILETKKIWATQYQYVNDSSELVYGRQLARDIIGMDYKAYNHVIIKKMLETLLEHIDSEALQTQSFIACFCEVPDLLSQWRGYSGKGTGYAIHFQPVGGRISLTDLIIPHPVKPRLSPPSIFTDLNYVWVKMNYDHEKHGDVITEIILRSCKFVREECAAKYPDQNFEDAAKYDESTEKTANTEVGERVAVFVMAALLQCFFRMKNRKFYEEQEWRINYSEERSEDPSSRVVPIDFRPSGGMLIPFVKIPFLHVNKRDVLNVRSVMCGPSPHPDLTRQSVKEFLVQRNFSGISVVTSDIPLRV